LITDDYKKLKLCDFGFSQTTSERDPSDNILCGSPIYMAPDTFRGRTRLKSINRSKSSDENIKTQEVKFLSTRGVGFNADLWAAGLILYEMTYGYHPCRGLKDIRSIEHVMNTIVVSMNQDVDMSIEGLLLLRDILNENTLAKISIDTIIKNEWIRFVETYDHIVLSDLFYTMNIIVSSPQEAVANLIRPNSLTINPPVSLTDGQPVSLTNGQPVSPIKNKILSVPTIGAKRCSRYTPYYSYSYDSNITSTINEQSDDSFSPMYDKLTFTKNSIFGGSNSPTRTNTNKLMNDGSFDAIIEKNNKMISSQTNVCNTKVCDAKKKTARRSTGQSNKNIISNNDELTGNDKCSKTCANGTESFMIFNMD